MVTKLQNVTQKFKQQKEENIPYIKFKIKKKSECIS